MADLLSNDLKLTADQSLLWRQESHRADLLRNRTLLDRLRSGSRGRDPAATRQALRQASREFEAVFMNQLVSAMRKTVGDGGLLQKSQGEKIFEGMLDEEWARRLVGRQGHGSLNELIYGQLSRRMGLATEDDPVPVRPGPGPGAGAGHPLLQQPAALPPAGLSRPSGATTGPRSAPSAHGTRR